MQGWLTADLVSCVFERRYRLLQTWNQTLEQKTQDKHYLSLLAFAGLCVLLMLTFKISLDVSWRLEGTFLHEIKDADPDLALGSFRRLWQLIFVYRVSKSAVKLSPTNSIQQQQVAHGATFPSHQRSRSSWSGVPPWAKASPNLQHHSS